MIEEHKANKEAEPLVISKIQSRASWRTAVYPGNVAAFDRKYDAEFGADTRLSPRNLVDDRQFEVRTPDVTIRVNPGAAT